MANYTPHLFTHAMRRVPRQVAQFPERLKFKNRMTRHKKANNAFVQPKAVVYPMEEELAAWRGGRPYTQEELWNVSLMFPMQRLDRIADSVTQLVRQERIEGRKVDLEDVRPYAELLIQLAARNGDRHRPTMEMVDFYLKEKDLVPKLFDVLVPRFASFRSCFTSLYTLPPEDLRVARQRNKLQLQMRGILELKGNPWPAVIPNRRDHSGLLTNVLLRAARSAREEELDRRARRSVAEKVDAVGESLEAPSIEAVASMTSATDSYLNLVDEDVERLELRVEDDRADDGVDDVDDDDDDDVNIQIKNLDLNLSTRS